MEDRRVRSSAERLFEMSIDLRPDRFGLCEQQLGVRCVGIELLRGVHSQPFSPQTAPDLIAFRKELLVIDVEEFVMQKRRLTLVVMRAHHHICAEHERHPSAQRARAAIHFTETVQQIDGRHRLHVRKRVLKRTDRRTQHGFE